MRVILKEPGCTPREVETDGTLEALQNLVGGYLEHMRIADGLGLLFDEEGKLKGKRVNLTTDYDAIVGNVIVVGDDGEDLTEVPEDRICEAMDFLRRYTLRR